MNIEIQIIIGMEIAILFSDLLSKEGKYSQVPNLFICIVI